MIHWLTATFMSLEMIGNFILLWMYILDWKEAPHHELWIIGAAVATVTVVPWFTRLAFRFAKKNLKEERKREAQWRASCKSVYGDF